ncbi:hypothetical protein PACILC2_12370 [Paenibacillus cisolokensis]|uniref:Chloride channel protein n=1 Tax=Paenibacillus cisolokensis TaxID=1658519 RepID=A0ABQ4N3D6_9BACL|nr:hypothetical protein PACILC2_12370 [Paenibacillus cisolokensis]
MCGQGKPNQSEEREYVNNGWDQNGKGLGMAQIARYGVKWLLLAAAAGVLAGTASALFLALLERATATREGAPWLLWLLPAAGALISYMYATVGGEAGKGNNLLIERIHEGRGTVPLRMAPLVLIGTVATTCSAAPPAGKGRPFRWAAAWRRMRPACCGYGRKTGRCCSCAAWPPASAPCSGRRSPVRYSPPKC